MPTNTTVSNLTINKVQNQDVYDYMLANGLIDENQLYLVGGDTDGSMSPVDKAKLDGIEEGATKVIVDDALDEESTNAIQNKVVTNTINELANVLSDIVPLVQANSIKLTTVPDTIEDTTYTTARYRASTLNLSETTPDINGVIAWTYE